MNVTGIDPDASQQAAPPRPAKAAHTTWPQLGTLHEARRELLAKILDTVHDAAPVRRPLGRRDDHLPGTSPNTTETDTQEMLMVLQL